MHSQQTQIRYWAAIAGELTVSILKLEVEGILAIKNGRLRQLEEKVGYSESIESGAALPDSTVDGLDNQDADEDTDPTTQVTD